MKIKKMDSLRFLSLCFGYFLIWKYSNWQVALGVFIILGVVVCAIFVSFNDLIAAGKLRESFEDMYKDVEIKKVVDGLLEKHRGKGKKE